MDTKGNETYNLGECFIRELESAMRLCHPYRRVKDVPLCQRLRRLPRPRVRGRHLDSAIHTLKLSSWTHLKLQVRTHLCWTYWGRLTGCP